MIDALFENVNISKVSPCGDDPSKIAVKFCVKNLKLNFDSVASSAHIFSELKSSKDFGVVKGRIGNYEIILFENGNGMIRLLDNLDVAKKIIQKILPLYSQGPQDS